MDLRPADIGLLVSLEALLDERGVTAAARRLGISQPALSAQLSRLRAMFADDLLVGNAHGMSLTPRAENLRSSLRSALEDLRAVVATGAGFDPATDRRHFTIAGSDLILVFLLPRLLPALARVAPNVTIEAVPPSIGQLAQRMEIADIDMAITSGENAPEGFPARKLLDESFQAIWRSGHPRIGKTISLPEFCDTGHLSVIVGGVGVLDHVDDALRAKSLSRTIVASAPNFLLAPPILRATDLVCVAPSFLASIAGEGLMSGPLPLPVPGFTLYLSWHRRQQNDKAHRWLRALIAQTLDPRRVRSGLAKREIGLGKRSERSAAVVALPLRSRIARVGPSIPLRTRPRRRNGGPNQCPPSASTSTC